MCRTPLLRRHPVSFTGLAFATTGRPLGLHPEVLALAAKRQLHTTDDDTVLLVHRPFTPSSLHDYTTLPPSLTPPRRVYFPIDAPVGSALIPRNHLISRGRFSDTQHAYALLVLDPHGHLHPLVAPPLPQAPGAQDIAPNKYLAYPFLSATERPQLPRQRRLFGPLPTTPQGNYYILLFTDRFSRRADMYVTAEAEITASGTADVLVDRYIPLRRCPDSLLSDKGLQFCSKLSRALYDRLRINKIATSSYH